VGMGGRSMKRTAAGLALALACAGALAPRAAAQGGYTQEKKSELGLSFPRARNYEEIPVQPTEEQIVLSFAEKVSTDPEKKRSVRPEMNFVWMERVPVRTADPTADAPPQDAGEEKEDAKPRAKPVDTIERFVETRFGGWSLGVPVPGKERDGYKAREFTLAPKKGGGSTGWVYSYEDGKRTIAIVGTCHEKDLKEQVKIWRYTAEHLDIDAPEEKSPQKIELFYARKPYKGIPYRVQVRMDMVRGWKAEDTENYIVIYDTPDQPLVRKILRDLELIRKEYELLFPPAKPVEAVSAVRVCKSKDEYHTYGGPERSAGYWNAGAEELVFYDAEKVDKQHRSSDADTFIVLYHEAFHQYIHYSTGELPPHSWFNEGHGDYFSGAQIRDGKLRGIGVNPWRIGTIQRAIGEDQQIAWKDMIRFEQPQYYQKDIVHICYAQGWAMVYFLRKSEQVAKRPEWAKILPTYFETLKTAYAEELAKIPEKDREKWSARAPAGLAARGRATDAAFDGVDLDELQQAWEKYTLGLEDPRKKK
jgi:hypothetical protein